MGYIRDGFNPRGAEYGATARAADAAAATQQSMDDMLELAMAPDETARQQAAQRIYERRQGEARRASRGSTIKWILLALIAAFSVAVWQLGDDGSSLSGAYRAFMATPTSHDPDTSAAPVRAVRAPDTQDSDDPAVVVARGEQVLRDSGMNDQQIHGNAQ